MKKKKTLKENFSWTFTGNVTYAISQWGLIVLLAKLGSPTIVGQFSLALAITAPIILFSNMQLRNIIATDSKDEFIFTEYFSTRVLSLIISLIIIVFISIFGNYNNYLTIIIILVGISKVIEALSEITHGYFQKIERMDYSGKSQMIKAVTSIVAFTLLFFLTHSLAIALIGMILTWLFRLLYYDLKIIKQYTEVKIKFDSAIRVIVLLALPLGFVSVLNSLNTNIPRYFLEFNAGVEELGYFSAIAYILVAGNLLIRPLSLVVAPKLAKSFQKGDRSKFIKINLTVFLFSLIIGVIAFVIVYFLGETILTLVYDENYARYNNLLLIMVVGSIVSYFTTFLNVSIVAAREFKKQPLINFITTLAALFSSILLIPKFGIKGAAIVTLIVFITQFLGSFVLFIYSIKNIEKKSGD